MSQSAWVAISARCTASFSTPIHAIFLKAFKKDSPRPLARLHIEASKPVFFSLRCQQCAEPACVYACLTGALSRNPETGLVTTDEDRCIGCWTCVLACPYGSIRPDMVKHKSVKCDLCQGTETPACVLNCPNEALSYEDTDGALVK